MLGEQFCALHVPRRNAKGVVKRCRIVHLQGNQTVYAAGFDHGRQVASDRWVLRLGAPILSSVAEVGRHYLHMASAGILECRAKKQQATQLIVCALPAIPIQRMEHHDLATVN
ncbi:hypothetical protein D3C80_1251570 [compost metagenome]